MTSILENNKKLPIPKLNNIKENGSTYEVIKVELKEEILPFITVKLENETKEYLLPNWYKNWVEDIKDKIKEGDKVEFGYYTYNHNYYAEILYNEEDNNNLVILHLRKKQIKEFLNYIDLTKPNNYQELYEKFTSDLEEIKQKITKLKKIT